MLATDSTLKPPSGSKKVLFELQIVKFDDSTSMAVDICSLPDIRSSKYNVG